MDQQGLLPAEGGGGVALMRFLHQVLPNTASNNKISHQADVGNVIWPWIETCLCKP